MMEKEVGHCGPFRTKVREIMLRVVETEKTVAAEARTTVGLSFGLDKFRFGPIVTIQGRNATDEEVVDIVAEKLPEVLRMERYSRDIVRHMARELEDEFGMTHCLSEEIEHGEVEEAMRIFFG